MFDLEEACKKIEEQRAFFVAGDEDLLKKLPRGNWIGGTIPYFMDVNGGTCTEEKVFLTEIPDIAKQISIKSYSRDELQCIPADSSENGFSCVVIPAMSDVHITYAKDAVNYKDIFMKAIIGWISGVHLDDLGKITPKVFNGSDGTYSDNEVMAMHFSLPESKMASVGIINLFKMGAGDNITFDADSFVVKDCLVNGERVNFAQYLTENNINTLLPLVADYCGTYVNVSIQGIDRENNTVNLYAPVFEHVNYRIASPVKDYVKEFLDIIPGGDFTPVFSCNCILNYLYSELEGKRTGSMVGPMTFGEVAHQLLNQTAVYLDLIDL
ncbi:MAG: hypothetical protein JXA66_07415 [Oligoflexia bacterium]|nr:hypothetical protein [Oligoflexia bacterium]